MISCTCVNTRSSLPLETDRGAWVRQVAAFPPGEVEAPDELQVEGMGGVEHGETHDVGLLIHYVIQPQQWEVLHPRKKKREMSDHADSTSSV